MGSLKYPDYMSGESAGIPSTGISGEQQQEFICFSVKMASNDRHIRYRESMVYMNLG